MNKIITILTLIFLTSSISATEGCSNRFPSESPWEIIESQSLNDSYEVEFPSEPLAIDAEGMDLYLWGTEEHVYTLSACTDPEKFGLHFQQHTSQEIAHLMLSSLGGDESFEVTNVRESTSGALVMIDAEVTELSTGLIDRVRIVVSPNTFYYLTTRGCTEDEHCYFISNFTVLQDSTTLTNK